LFHGAPALGIDPNADDLLTADKLWPIVRGLLQHLTVDSRDYLVEGVSLRPAPVAGMIAESGTNIRACFLGYPGLKSEAKANLVRRFGGLPNDWLNTMGAEFVEEHLPRCADISIDFQSECAGLDLPFFDTGQDFETAMRAAEHALFGYS
jgi:hypothetical protein